MNQKYPVLLIDDEEEILLTVSLLLKQGGIHNVVCCDKSTKALEMLKAGLFGAVVLDLTMPELSGEKLLNTIHENYPELPVIVLTGLSDIQVAVKCMRSGAFDYMVKPIEVTRLISGVSRALEVRELRDEYTLFKDGVTSREVQDPDAFSKIVTQNAAMYNVFHYIEAVAKSSRPLLITGETGVGKELLARATHEASHRRGEFIAVNIAGLDDNMFSDTLFGHKKGAFTGADADRPGMVRRATGGTLFLDELGDLSQQSQIKLLRLLQDNEFTPLGSDVPLRSDARIVVATNRDLRAQQEAGQFRRDLFYRLQSHYIQIPPLRERIDDLPLLLDKFLTDAARELEKKKPTAPKELFTWLATYHFPGNVRELESMVFDAVSQHDSKTLSVKQFYSRVEQTRSSASDEKTALTPEMPFALFEELPTLKASQALLIEESLRRANGNQTLAAKLLGITQSGLSKALKRQRQ